MEFLSPVSTNFQNEGEIGNKSWPFSLSTDHIHPFIFASAHCITSLKMLKHCAVTVVTDTENAKGLEVPCSAYIFKAQPQKTSRLETYF